MRKTLFVTIASDNPANRDGGKTFLITEMAARPAEKWAERAWLAIANSGMDIPNEAIGGGWPGLFLISLQKLAGAKWSDLDPLLDELMTCVKFVPSPNVARPLVDNGTDGDDIEEVETRIRLKADVFNLHAGFFIDGVKSRLGLAPTSSP
jgi:hypothetical protein